MADQTSSGVSERPEARPLVAREMSTRIKTRPISKIMARILFAGTGYSPSAREIAAERWDLLTLSLCLARRMLMIAGRIEREMTTAMT